MKYTNVFLSFYVFTLIIFWNRPEYTIVEDISGLVLGVVFFTEILVYDKALKWHWTISWVVLFVAFSCISVIIQPNSARLFITFLFVIILFYIVFNVVSISGSITSVWVGMMSGLSFIIAGNYSKVLDTTFGFYTYRVEGALGNPNLLSFSLISFIILLVHPLLKTNFSDSNHRYLWVKNLSFVVILCVALMTIISTGSRKGVILSFVLLVGVCWVISSGLSLTWGVLNISLFASSSYLLYHFVPHLTFSNRFSEMYRLFSGIRVADASLINRTLMFREGVNLWQERPLLGWGFDAFRYVSDFNTYSHSNYVEMLCNHGLLGFVLFYGLHMSLLLLTLTYSFSEHLKVRLRYRWCLLLLGLLLIWDVAAVSYFYKLYWVMLGVLLAGVTGNLSFTARSSNS